MALSGERGDLTGEISSDREKAQEEAASEIQGQGKADTEKGGEVKAKKMCRWKCGRPTENHSGICDFCWQEAEQSRSMSDQGYRAWIEKKIMEKEPKETKTPRTEAQRNALKKARQTRKAKLLKEVPDTARPAADSGLA